MNRRKFIGLTATSLLTTNGMGFAMNKETKAKQTTGIHVRFLGTGAADWFKPNAAGEFRRRSSILLNREVLIDFTPYSEDMLPSDCHPHTIFYTHSHPDHYIPEAALKIGIRQVYVGETWYDICRTEFAEAAQKLSATMPKITPLAVGQCVEAGGMFFTALPANHGTGYIKEQALLYLVEQGEVRLIYATDTGGLPCIATRLAGIDSHYQVTPITALIMEATMGMGFENDYRIFTHSSVALVKQTVDILTETKAYMPPAGQKVYLTHMGTMHGPQAELDRDLPAPLCAPYDGLEVTFMPPGNAAK